MNFKSFALKAAIAATVLTGSTLAVSPAEAITFGSKLNFYGTADATSNINEIDFYLQDADESLDGPGGENIGQFLVSGPRSNTNEFQSLARAVGTIKDIQSLPVFQAINNFLFFGQNSPFNFNLTSFTKVSDTTYNFEGVFADNTLGSGQFTTQVIAPGVNSYSVTITAGNEIPTPALLPGLIGMGAAVLRKRNAEETEQVEAEA
jgi:hypothetical protein